MSFLSSLADAGNNLLKVFLPSTIKLKIGSVTITASELETSTGTLANFLVAIQAAVKAKDYASETELSIEEGLTIAADLGIGEPYTGIMKVLFPIIYSQAQQIITTPVFPVDGGKGGFVTQAWINNARERIDANGNFISN